MRPKGVKRSNKLPVPATRAPRGHKAVMLRTFPSVPATLELLSKLRKEVRSASTFEQLDTAARTAAGIQRAFKPVKEVADSAGEVWIDADARLGEELAKLPKAKGGEQHHKHPTGTKREPVPTLAELGVDKKRASRAKRLNRIPQQKRDSIIVELKQEGKGVTPAAVLKKQQEADRAAKRATYSAAAKQGGKIDDLRRLAESGQKFSVIYADPPWTFEVYSGKGKDRSAERHYDTMTLDDICALEVRRLAADDCALLLWSVWPEMPGAMRVIESWGFTYKTCGFLWVKQNRTGNGFFTGMGYWTRANTEPCLLATRGSPTRLAMDVPQLLLSPVGTHSKKPAETAKRVERLLPGPYLELFARERRRGWTTWGNEISASVEILSRDENGFSAVIADAV